MSETWKPIPGHEGRYEASDLGRIRSVMRRKPRILATSASPASRGYLRVRMAGQHLFVHTLVASAWLGPRPAGMDVCHNDGDRSDARVSNLRYDTRKGNLADRDAHGTMLRGDAVRTAKLTTEQALEILAAQIPQRALAIRFGVSQRLVRRIQAGVAWPHLSRQTIQEN